MIEPVPRNEDGTRKLRAKRKVYRVHLSSEEERMFKAAADRRHIETELLLALIIHIIIDEKLIEAILDDGT